MCRESHPQNVVSWADDADQLTMQQAYRTARSPVMSGHLALMPDAHFGVGATIGSVIPTEAGIIPAAVGVDLGCGMTAWRLSITADELPWVLEPVLSMLGEQIPAGFHWHDAPLTQAHQVDGC